jgi:CheY-like chemotaxis protein
MLTNFPVQDTTRRRRILLVEDNTDLRRLLGELFRLNGYDTDVAANGQEALDQIGQHAYDAIVCDVHMPVLNGREMFDACREQFPEATNKIIFMTGAWYADSEEMCKETGRPYLLKSFAWEYLHRLLLQVFEANEPPAAAPGQSSAPKS